MIKKTDPKVAKIIAAEVKRQNEELEMIPSENITSPSVREAMASVFNDKYSEGKPHARYYGGQINVDEIEDLAASRALKMFRLSSENWHANVQPYSGSPANYEIYLALLNFGDRVLGMKLDQGGHITHGLPVGFSGMAYKFSSYGVEEKSGMINYDEVLKIARATKPKLIICGATAYSRIIDFKKFGEIAKEVGAYLMADISHIAGLVVGGVHPSPFPYADVVMTTTHKTLRGPRGAIIICKKELAEKIDRAVFPGFQGGPHEHQIAAKAVCFGEALDPEFKTYAKQIVKNAKALAKALQRNDLKIVTDGTDNHLMLIDLRNLKINGKEAQNVLEASGIIVNKSLIPYDSEKPFIGSGIRLGTPAITTRGMKEKEMAIIANLITNVLKEPKNKKLIENTKNQVKKLTSKFPRP